MIIYATLIRQLEEGLRDDLFQPVYLKSIVGVYTKVIYYNT